jgi:LacI family transcriptional regulator
MKESEPSSSTPPSTAILEKAFSRPWDGQLPLHAKVYRGLRYAIEKYFEDGQRFFTEKELIEYLKVSQVTVRRAVYDLVGDGMLERRVAKGSFVRKPKPEEGKTHGIAIHLVDWDSSFLSHLMREVLSACRTRGLGAKVFYSGKTGDILSQEGELWSQSDISAAILIATPPDLASEICQRYEALNKTVVAVDTRAPSDKAHFVGTDNLATTKIGLDHLAALGHQRICLLVNEPEASENVIQRTKSFEDECRARGIDGQVVHCGTQFWEDSYTKAYSAMPQVLALKPTAIFAFDDPGAWAGLKWCTTHNVNVPRDLSILGFANDKPSAFTHPALSTIAHPIQELAAKAVEFATGQFATQQVQLYTPSLVVRESTGPAK